MNMTYLQRVTDTLKAAQYNPHLSKDEIKAIRLKCEEIKSIIKEAVNHTPYKRKGL